MSLVIDASVVTALCMARGGFGLLDPEVLLAPVLVRSEVASALCSLEWRREISRELADAAVERLREAPIELVVDAGLTLRAIHLARSLGWAKSYDAEYVSLAMVRDCPLMTIDDRLARRVAHLVETRRPV